MYTYTYTHTTTTIIIITTTTNNNKIMIIIYIIICTHIVYVVYNKGLRPDSRRLSMPRCFEASYLPSIQSINQALSLYKYIYI